MNYNQVKRQFRKNQIKSTQRLLKLTRVMFYLLDTLNNVDNKLLKFMTILLGFQYDIYIKLREVSYDNTYLEHAKIVEFQIQETIKALGE